MSSRTEQDLLKPRDMSQPLPWPRGQVPRFPGQKRPDYSKPHWKIGQEARCAQCKSVLPCIHKNEHYKRMCGTFADPSSSVQHPDFMIESSVWQSQLKDARADNGDRRLPIGQRLPAGQRHGWGSYAGYEAPMGTTRDMGEYRLVFVSHDKTQQGGSQSPAMGKGSPALGGGGGGELLGGKKDVLDVASQAEAHGKSPTPTIIASETARNMYQSFKQQSLERAWAGASTPDLVEAINDLRMTEMQRHGQSTGQRQGEGGAGQAGGPKSHSVPLSTERSSAGDRTVLPYVLPSGSRRVTQVGGPAGGNLSPTEWEGYHRSMQRVKKLQELKEGPEARLSYRGGRLVLAASHENTPTKTEIIDKMSPVVTRRNPAEAVELHFKKMAIKKVQREREIKEGKRRKRKGH